MLSFCKWEKERRKACMKVASKEHAKQITVDFLKKRKKVDEIHVASVEKKDGVWVVNGTSPIDVQGHPWTEKFEVRVDRKGKVTSTRFSLL
jgi:hypothetical protein